MKSKFLLVLIALGNVNFAFAGEGKTKDKPAPEKKTATTETCGECCEAEAKPEVRKDVANPAPAAEGQAKS